MVFSNNLSHIQQHLQADSRCQAHTKPRDGNITSKHEDTLAHKKFDEKWKSDISGNSSTTTMLQSKGRGAICVD